MGRFRLKNTHPRLSEIYAARHVECEEDIDHRLEGLIPPAELPGIETALEVLEEHLRRDASIMFIGDFDADGATSTAVGMKALSSMGASRLGYLVPNRFDHGYGLSPEIAGIASSRRPELLITVDNGISSLEGVDAARDRGMSVIVTDHHLPGDSLPTADAIVNPNLRGSRFGSGAMAGVGVIFYLMAALRSRRRDRGWFSAGRPQPNLADLLDLVAIGTVADLVPLDRNNRILVANGLARINAGRAGHGVSALLAYCSNRIGEIAASDLGFGVAPRLNAAGRLEDMSLGVECLLSAESAASADMARELDRLNRERREIESGMKIRAMEIVDEMEMSGAPGHGLCLFDEQWHQGIVGLVAGRIKDLVGAPVIAFALAGGDELKGSARSVPGLHIRDVLSDISTRHPGLIDRFGGHAAAAGLSLRREHLESFSEAFSAAVEARGGNAGGQIVYSDGGLADEDLSLEFADLLRRSGPWGQQFPEPVFDDEFQVLDSRVVGGAHLKMRVRRIEGGATLDAISFYHEGPGEQTIRGSGVHMLYRLEINDYRGLRTPQLIVEHLLPC